MQSRALFLLVLAASQLGCGIGRSLLSDIARSKFSRRYSCPEDRLTMRRLVVNREALLVAPAPPPDVAADPGRLAIWRANAIDDVKDYWDMTAVRVQGCDIDRTYLCWSERAPYADEIDYHCDEVDLTASLELGRFTLSSRVQQQLRRAGSLEFGLVGTGGVARRHRRSLPARPAVLGRHLIDTVTGGHAPVEPPSPASAEHRA